jgi:DNA-binding response OmpR family regulator
MKRYKILIVDDYPNMVDMLSVRLRAAGFDVIAAYDGMAGLQMARHENPDLVILDVLLPKMDGFKICRMLKYDERFRHIPVIMLTSRARDIDRKMGLDMGADDYVFKPYDPGELMQRIDKLLELSDQKAASLVAAQPMAVAL